MTDKNSLETAKTRGAGRPFTKGQSGNPTGRPRGTPNRATVEVKVAARLLVEDPEYRRRLLQRLRAGKAGALEPLLWFYAFGKPTERIEANIRPPLAIVFRTAKPDEDPLAS